MRIPTQNLQQVTISPRPADRVASNAGDMKRQQGELIEKTVTAFGQTAVAAGETYRAIQHATETARVQEAQLSLDELNSKSLDELRKRQGSDAAGIEAEAPKLYEANQKQATAKLQTERERKAFDLSTRSDRMNWDNHVRDHVTVQADKYQDEQTDAAASKAINDAYDPGKTADDRAASRAKAENGIRARAQRRGLPPEVLQQQLGELHSQATQTEVAGLLDRHDLEAAKKAYATAQAKGTILPQNRQQIENLLKTKTQDAREISTLETLLKDGKKTLDLTTSDGREAALKKARELPDDLQDGVVQRLEQRSRQDTYTKETREKENFSLALDEIHKNGEISSSTDAILTPEQRYHAGLIKENVLQKEQAKWSFSAKIESKRRSSEARDILSTKTMQEIERIPEIERASLFSALDDDDKKWMDARRGERKDVENLKAKALKETVDLLDGVDKKGKHIEADPKVKQQMRDEFERSFAQLEADSNGKPIQEGHLILLRQSLLAKATNGKPMFQLSPTERIDTSVRAFDSVDDLKKEIPALQDPERYQQAIASIGQGNEKTFLDEMNRRAAGVGAEQWKRAQKAADQNDQMRQAQKAQELKTAEAAKAGKAAAEQKAAQEDRDHESYGGRILDAFHIPTEREFSKWIFSGHENDRANWNKYHQETEQERNLRLAQEAKNKKN